MSRIVAAVTVGATLLIGSAALGSALEETDAGLADDLAPLFSTGFELGSVVPILLLVGLLIAALGVMAR